jgi:hypothetical protein
MSLKIGRDPKAATMAKTQTRQLRKAIVIMFAGMFFAQLYFTIFLDHYFYRTRPRQPEPISGRIYPRYIHYGTRVYLTRTETLPFDYIWVCGLSLCIAALLNQHWDCFPPLLLSKSQWPDPKK